MKIDTLEPEFKPVVEQLLTMLQSVTGYTWVVTSGRRTIAQQNNLYEQGRSLKGDIVTNAKGGQSPHNFGLAADVAPTRAGEIWWNAPQPLWDAVGATALQLGLKWGGAFKSITDKPHVEAADWKETQLAWKQGKIEVA